MQEFPGTYLKAYVALRGSDGLPVDIVVKSESESSATGKIDHVLQMLKALVSEAGHSVETYR